MLPRVAAPVTRSGRVPFVPQAEANRPCQHLVREISLFVGDFSGVFGTLCDLVADHLAHENQLSFSQIRQDRGAVCFGRGDFAQLLLRGIDDGVDLATLDVALADKQSSLPTFAIKMPFLSFLTQPSLKALPWPTLALSFPTRPCTAIPRCQQERTEPVSPQSC